MTVTSTNQKVQFNGNGSTTVFAYNFKIFAQTDLSVILRSAAGTETVQQLTTNYTVSGVGETSGGNVTMGTAPPSGTTLTILRVQPNLQGLDLVPNDPFPAGSMEDALDKLTFMVQTHDEEIGRSIKASPTNVISDTEFNTSATDRANKLFSFDGSGDLQISQELGTYKGDWAASTGYAVRDLVKDTSTNNIFIAVTAHTSSGSQPLTTNTDAAKWALIVDAASATTSATAAASSATAAASSATASASSASTSSTKADEAAASASTASTKAGEAATSATASASSATASASSATAAASSATAAAASAADVAKVQGITDGTVAANKAMVVDANKDISGVGLFSAVKASAESAIFGRNTSDGNIVNFQKDGSTVGSIGADGSSPYFATATGSTLIGIKMQGGSTPRVSPTDGSGDVTDGVATIGFTTSRFKDLYLSGGVFLGGTGSANKLEDYETGNWTPSFNGLTNTPTFSNLFGKYTKIGRAVTVQLFMQSSSTLPTFSSDTDPVKITGLPFTVAGSGYTGSQGVALTQAFRFDGTHNSAGVTGQVASGVNSSEQMQFYVTVSGGTRGVVRNSSVTAGFIIEATVTYFVSD